MIARNALLLTALLSAPTLADDERSLYELMSGWGTDLDGATLSSESLGDGLHVMRAAGGAILVSIGEDGVLLVDDQFPQVLPKIRRQIAKLGGRNDGHVDYVINTHWHFDHADGNPALGEAGATILAHENSRAQMMQRTRVQYVGYHYQQPPYPASGLPALTFNDQMSLFFNGQEIQMRYFGPGHTTGDAAVFFQDSNVVHVGDLYSGGYPYIDAGNGGSLAGLVAVCRSILDHIDEQTTVVSGHAPITNRKAMLNYVHMLETSYEAIDSLVKRGLSLDEVLAAKPTAQFDEQRGNPTMFVTMAYRSIVQGN